MRNFAVHSNESAYIKSGRLGLDQVRRKSITVTFFYVQIINNKNGKFLDNLSEKYLGTNYLYI